MILARAVEAPVERPRTDRWQQPTAIASAAVGGLGGRDRALATIAWIVPALFCVALGFVRIAWPSPSGDELALWRYAGLSRAAAVGRLLDLDVHNIAYYLLTWDWAQAAGTSDFALRVPSVLLMAGAAALTAVLGTRLAGPRVGLLAGLIFAAVPTVSRFGQEAGPTSLTVFASVLATYALVALFDRPGDRECLGYLSAVALLGLSNVLALSLLLAHAVLVVAVRRRVLLRWLVAALVGAAPAVVLVAAARTRWPEPDPAIAIDRLIVATFGTALLGGMVICAALFAISVRRPAITVSAAAVIPTAALFLAAYATRVDLATAAVWTLPAWACLAALALRSRPATAGLAVVSVIALAGVGAQLDLRQPDGHGQATREIAMLLSDNLQPGDAIVLGPTGVDATTGRDIVARYLPADRTPRELLEVVDAPRVWLLRPDRAEDPLGGFPSAQADPLRTRYAVQRQLAAPGFLLVLFVIAPVQAGPIG